MKQVLEMVLDVKSWCWMALMFLVSLPSGAIATFGPLIIRGFGFDGYVPFQTDRSQMITYSQLLRHAFVDAIWYFTAGLLIYWIRECNS